MSFAATQRHKSRGARCLTTAVACAVLLGQLAGLAHQLVVRHTACAEHGELLHAGDTSSERRLAPASDAALTARATDAFSSSDDGHDHCLVASHRSAYRAPPAAVAPASDRDGAVPLAVVAPDAPRPAAVAVFRTAPKNSPPLS